MPREAVQALAPKPNFEGMDMSEDFDLCDVCGSVRDGREHCNSCRELEYGDPQPDPSLILALQPYQPFYVVEQLNIEGEKQKCECCGKLCSILIHIRSIHELTAEPSTTDANIFLCVCLAGRCGELLCGKGNWKSSVIKRAMAGLQAQHITEEDNFNPPKGLV